MSFTQSPLYVVDTNVWLVARDVADVDTECHLEALEFLYYLNDNKKCIAVDDQHLILGEYFGLLSQQFIPHLILTEIMRDKRVSKREIDVFEGMAVLPDELGRIVHDRNDRKFVAVSLAFSTPPPIVNATDSDWADWEAGLRDHGIEVIQLCPELVNAPRDAADHRA